MLRNDKTSGSLRFLIASRVIVRVLISSMSRANSSEEMQTHYLLPFFGSVVIMNAANVAFGGTLYGSRWECDICLWLVQRRNKRSAQVNIYQSLMFTLRSCQSNN